MYRFSLLALASIPLGAAVFACGGNDGERRVVAITQTDDACSPAALQVGSGEHIRFEVKNDGKKDAEVEGIEGTKLEEVLVPAHKTRNVNWNAPDSTGTQKIKCYVPGGQATIIEVSVGPKSQGRAIRVELGEYSVVSDVAGVSAGKTTFIAQNNSKTEVHELAVLRVKADGSFDNLGEVEDLDPGTSGEVALTLPKGQYVLACLIVPGEEGSKVDHFKQGMRIDFAVN